MNSGVEEIIGTAFGISQPDVEVLQDWLSPILAEQEVELVPVRSQQRIILAGDKLKAADIFDVSLER